MSQNITEVIILIVMLADDYVTKPFGMDELLTETEYLRVLMGRVRRKLEVDHSRPRHFRTEPGMGYRFEP